MLHARCYVAAGGCPTRGCANASKTLALGSSTEVALWQRQARARQAHSVVVMGGGACGGAGALGMVLSMLEILSQGYLVGTFGFVAGAVLLSAGLVVLALAATRPVNGQRPVVLYPLASMLSGLLLLSGLGGMGLSFVVLSVGAYMTTIVGGGGFAAGAMLVFGGAVSSALLLLEQVSAAAPPAPQQSPTSPTTGG
jgi:hypothetical protein